MKNLSLLLLVLLVSCYWTHCLTGSIHSQRQELQAEKVEASDCIPKGYTNRQDWSCQTCCSKKCESQGRGVVVCQ